MPEAVGSRMAEAYALLYEVPRSSVLNAAILRARAAKLRDTQAQQPNWKTIEELLKESSRELHTALNQI